MKKFLSYILILVIFFGLLGPVKNAHAEEDWGICLIPATFRVDGTLAVAAHESQNYTQIDCEKNVHNKNEKGQLIYGKWTRYADGKKLNGVSTGGTQKPTGPDDSKSQFEKQVEQRACIDFTNFNMGGCLVWFAYFVFYQLPAWILLLCAKLFNALIAISLSSTLFAKSTFIPTAWAVVRDLSNIFFILVLLYISVQIILDIGGGGHGGGPKKMIAQVIIMALLINFSLFFTRAVIDSANILALVFYSKLTITTKNGVNSAPTPYPYSTSPDEKDLAGAMVNSFNPTSALTWENFFLQSRTQVINGQKVLLDDTPTGITLGLILVSGAIMLFAAYAFLIAGLSFLGRLIELWVLMIFSPFAFMSSTLPILKHIPDVGWDAWLKKLFEVAFMAPVFMFFMYFIFMLLRADLFGGLITQQDNLLASIMLFVIPALVILTLLMRATAYAKKGAGKIGEMAASVGSAAAGLALGAATGGAATLLRASAGRAGSAVANSDWAKRYEARGGWGGEMFRDAAKGVGKASFDVRGVKIGGQTLAGATGLNIGSAKSGGFEQARKEQVAKRQQRAKDLEVGEDEDMKQKLNAVERDLQDLLSRNSHRLAELDRDIKGARENAQDLNQAAAADPTNAAKRAAADAAQARLEDLKGEKRAIKNASAFRTSTGTTIDHTGNRTADGHSINDLEDREIPNAHHAIEEENRQRKWDYATTSESVLGQAKGFILSGGQYTPNVAREAAHKIRMNSKIDTPKGGGDDHGGGSHPAAASHPPAAAHPPAAGGHGPAH